MIIQDEDITGFEIDALEILQYDLFKVLPLDFIEIFETYTQEIGCFGFVDEDDKIYENFINLYDSSKGSSSKNTNITKSSKSGSKIGFSLRPNIPKHKSY